jgi:hypothetical protein
MNGVLGQEETPNLPSFGFIFRVIQRGMVRAFFRPSHWLAVAVFYNDFGFWAGTRIGGNGRTLIETLYKNGLLERMGRPDITDRQFVSPRRISFVIDLGEIEIRAVMMRNAALYHSAL